MLLATSIHVGAWALGLSGIRLLGPEFRRFRPQSASGLESARLLLKDLRESLLAGELPGREQWLQVSRIPEPWGPLIEESLSELRESGLPVVPTLERMEALLAGQITAASQARARSAQAWGQAVICGSFVPIVAMALYFLLPGVAQLGLAWWLLTLLACLMSAGAMLWMLSLCTHAQWAGLGESNRSCWPALLCFCERLLSSLRAGVPADLAWARALPQISRQASTLVLHWGAEFWLPRPVAAFSGGTMGLLEQWGQVLRESLQRSVLEGRPCTERLETSLSALRQEWDSRVERELSLLGTRALKPLFLLVAPSLLGLLAVGVMAGIQW
jgi:hypothetical protein